MLLEKCYQKTAVLIINFLQDFSKHPFLSSQLIKIKKAIKK